MSGKKNTDRADINGVLARAVLAIGTSDFFARATGYLRATANFKGVFVTELHGRKQPLHIYDNVRSDRRFDVIDTYLDRSYLLDPFFDSHLKDTSTRIVTLDQVSPDRFQSSTYFKIYYKDLNLQDEAGVFIQISAKRVLFYSLGRHHDERRFSKLEIGRLGAILPVFSALNLQHFNKGFRHDADRGGGHDIDSALARFGRGVLTPREREIANLILKGHSSRSIAERTQTSVATVKTHRKNLFRKLRISSQGELFHTFFNSAFG
jgi:DNA-binding CsgD family transcriptional regulator